MAKDYFIGWTMADKLAVYRGIQEAMLTGNVMEIQTAHGVMTKFDPKTNSPDALMERLEYSVTQDAAFDPTNATQAAMAANGRPGITRAKFN